MNTVTSPPPSSVTGAPGGLPLLGHALRLLRSPLDYLQSLRGLGDIVQIRVGSSPLYVVTSSECIHQVLVTHAESFERGRLFDKATAAIGKGLVVSNGSFHRRQRKLLQPGFHRARIHGYMETIHRQVDAQIAGWSPGAHLSLREEMHRLTLNAVTGTLFGANTEERIAIEIGDYIDAANSWVGLHTVFSGHVFERLPIPINQAFVRKKARFNEIIAAYIESRRADDRDQGDLLSALLAAQDDETGQGMSDEQLRMEISGLFVAGSETTATALTWLFHEVGRHPEVEARLHAEVDAVLGGRPVTMEDLPRLQYLQNVISETLRRHSPIWVLTRRTLRAMELAGTHLPAGAEVIISPMMVHRDPRLHPEPLRFDPDRWLPERMQKIPRHAFIPFGEGKHKCIGDVFARTEMVIAVATIASRWRLVPVPGHRVREVPRAVLRPNQVLMTAVPRSSTPAP
ncbi:cytochrome P450 [Cystobacter fuscus]|uniref:cytochrome P450 n=1 Tax=Cystobacter fuscus TaxID=43 RepID=UPI002B291E2E|nr:cytochrome P450 [Cystobacter fuscus]